MPLITMYKNDIDIIVTDTPESHQAYPACHLSSCQHTTALEAGFSNAETINQVHFILLYQDPASSAPTWVCHRRHSNYIFWCNILMMIVKQQKLMAFHNRCGIWTWLYVVTANRHCVLASSIFLTFVYMIYISSLWHMILLSDTDLESSTVLYYRTRDCEFYKSWHLAYVMTSISQKCVTLLLSTYTKSVAR